MADELNAETESFNQDFTTATRWEVFCARLEEIIHEWKLPFKKQLVGKLPFNVLSTDEWETKEELVTYDGMELKVTLYSVKLTSDNEKLDDLSPESARRASVDAAISAQTSLLHIDSECQAFVDLMSLENNWCTLDEKSNLNIHPIARWYGLRQFIVIATVGGATINENQRRILLSSVHLAVGETNISIPVFVQALKFQQHVYSGTFGASSLIHVLALISKTQYFFSSFVLQVYVNTITLESTSTLCIWLKRIPRASI